MSLGRRLFGLILTLGLGLTLIACTAAWGVSQLSRNLSAALKEYDQLRLLYDLGLELTRIDQAIKAGRPPTTTTGNIELQRQGLIRLEDPQLRRDLKRALADPRGPELQIHMGLNLVMGAIAATKGRIRDLDQAARRLRHSVLIAMTGLCVLTLSCVAMMVRGQLRALNQQIRSRSTELARAERLASVGFLAAGVAHEINNPLGIIAGEAELVGRHASDEKIRTAMRVIVEEAARTRAITDKLLALASPQRSEPTALAWTDVVDDVLATVARMERFAERVVEVKLKRDGVVNADRTLLGQVVLNLVVNALDATGPSGGKVAVEIDAGRLSVVDDGPGLGEDEMARVFEPFYRSGAASPGTGHGLGLSISLAIVRRLGGELTATSAGPGRGCRFTVAMPEVQA